MSALKPFVHDAQKYNAFMDYLDMRIERETKVMEDLVNPHDFYRAQGKVKSLRMLKNLREEVINSEATNGTN